MQKKMLEFIKKHQMFQPGDRVIIGLSGGADSVCLLVLLHEVRETLGIELRAVHVHHGLRGAEADRDAAYARELSDRLEVPFVLVRCSVASFASEQGISVEEAGRILRYRVFREELERWGGNKIAVAHHAGDNAETILHHLFRGSGLKGIGGIAPFKDGLARPLLTFTREEILNCLKERNITYCEDSTNASDNYTRNKLRNQVIPLIQKTINEGAVNNILRVGELASEADAYLEQEAQRLLKQDGIKSAAGYGIPVDQLLEKAAIIRKYTVQMMIKECTDTGKDITSIHINEVCGLLEKPVGRSIDLPYGLKAVRDYSILWITNKTTSKLVEKVAPELEYRVFPYQKGQDFPKNQYTKWFDYDRIKGALSVRYRETGDYITLPTGGRKTVKSYMIDEKIPKEARGTIPLLADGSHILWIIGYRISEYYKLTEETRTVLQVQFNGGKNDG